ncbi:DUF3883 domain-containing protein [Nostoc sp. 'Peltigera malacea cyanobiont' DB3992]|uniref:DUF3883 domain-containing protein n=1 Tax=Nostoc sp. 'Peltigera malacea cyanobiont' DB3992 TaxID=1206980 RepID=UPI000C03E180|nr:DUF3883 domain-containing protein [Nostoc sp. 'Peltigera malacea cyanobiont' DB3992]PHM10162.1 hypothetical protein CK516_10115 [Nostoc sp. 'Peltigera malacea cyanobiont' DB3992]
MVKPKQIIEDIRKNTYGIGLQTDQAAQGVIDNIRRSLNSALERLSVDLYSKETHFVLELIQNADDNQYESAVIPTLNLTIEPQKIIVQNNELGFSEDNVRAICDVGRSTKTKVEGYIGEKGIGFKSVFRISNEPQIFSNGFQFHFKHQDDENQLGFVIPYWIEAIPKYVNSTLTNIILPLRESAKDELGKLGEIEHTLILFLRQLKTVKIDNRVNDKSHEITRLDKDGKIEIQENTESGLEKHCYKLVKKGLIVPEYIQESKRENVKSSELILAFSLQEDGTADTRLEQKVFAFLPTRSYGFKFLIQADFLVPANREDIHKDIQWNKWIRDNIASTFLLAVEEFKQDRNLQKTYYDYIPLNSEVKDEFFTPVVSEIHNKLKVSKCILTESGKWQIPSHVMQVDEQIRNLISNTDLQELLNKEYIHPKVKAKFDILESLGVKKIIFDDLLQCLQNNEWLQKQSDNWFVELYIYLKSCNLNEYSDLPRIKKLKIIPLENNQLASTAETSIFFPLNLNNTAEYSFELKFIKKTLVETTFRYLDFLKKLGIQNASCYEIIENHILPLYKGDSCKNKVNQLLEYICYIKDNLSEYEIECNKRNDSYLNKDPLNMLKMSFLIKTDRNEYLRPTDIYIPAIYHNSNELETLLAGIKDVYFVSSEYIIQDLMKINSVSDKLEKIREWREFFVRLGVHILPKIDVKIKTEHGRSNKGNRYSQEYTTYSSPHILKIFEAKDEEKNQKLAKLLDSNWDYYKQYKSWRSYYYSNGSFYLYRPNDADWFTTIKIAAWLPTTKGTLANSSEIFLAEPETVSILGDSVSYLAITLNNQDFIKDLGIKSKITDPKDYADLLLTLSRKNELDEKDEELVLKIYQQLNKPDITSKDWWKTFIIEKIFWTNQRTFSTASKVLINDNDKVYELFKDNPQIAFLKLPSNYCPKLQHFIKATDIRYLSQIIKTELAIGEVPKVEEESLTEKIKALIPYVLRYLYQVEQPIYQQLKTNHTLIQLKDLVCYRVEKLQIKYILDQQSAYTQRSAFLYNENLYIQSDSLSDMDYLALEISQLFGNPKGLDDFLILLFEKRTLDKIDSLMKAKNIQPLPNEEKQWFESSNIYLGETNFIEIAAENDKNIELSAKKHQKLEPDNRSVKSELTTIYPKDEVFDDAQWQPECEPREILELEAIQLTKAKITSQGYPSTGRVTESIITPSFAELIEDESISDKTTFSNSQSELAPQKIIQLITELRIIDRDEPSEKPKLSGIWGEKFAVEYLRRKFGAKYPQGKLNENKYGFSIKINSQLVVEVQWLNEVQETEGYDIKLIENGRKDYIEVKSSKPGAKKLIKLSGSQWKLALDLGENFHIYRVYDAGTQQATLIDISNPNQLFSEGSLRIYSVYLRI